MTPDEPDAGEAKAKKKVRDDVDEFKQLVENAEVVDVGVDTEYVPDSPRLRESHPNADDGE